MEKYQKQVVRLNEEDLHNLVMATLMEMQENADENALDFVKYAGAKAGQKIGQAAGRVKNAAVTAGQNIKNGFNKATEYVGNQVKNAQEYSQSMDDSRAKTKTAGQVKKMMDEVAGIYNQIKAEPNCATKTQIMNNLAQAWNSLKTAEANIRSQASSYNKSATGMLAKPQPAEA